MRRYMNQKTKLGRFLARNGGNLWGGLKTDVSVTLYKKAWVRRLVRGFYKETKPQKWLFLVGCYNSGTTILRDILEAHPQVSSLPFEGVKLTDAFPNLEEGGWPRMMYRHRDLWDQISENAGDRARRDWAPWWRKDASVYLEKSIDHSTRIKWLDKNFTNAYFLSITRNGLSVIEGISRRAKPYGSARYELKSDTYPYDMIADQWVEFENKISEDIKYVENGLRVTYEDLVDNPVKTLSNIFNFLGLSDVHVSKNGVKTIVNGRVYELINQNNKAISRLDAVTKKQIRDRIGSDLERIGY